MEGGGLSPFIESYFSYSIISGSSEAESNDNDSNNNISKRSKGEDNPALDMNDVCVKPFSYIADSYLGQIVYYHICSGFRKNCQSRHARLGRFGSCPYLDKGWDLRLKCQMRILIDYTLRHRNSNTTRSL